MASSFPMKKNTAMTVVFPILDADGDLVTAATALDSEYSLDGGAFTDCASEATEIGTTGIYSLALAAGETNGDVVCIQVKTTTSGAKTTVLVFYTSAQTLDDLEALVDDLETRLGTPSNLGSGATVAANLVDVEGQTDDIGAAGVGLTEAGSHHTKL